jgi:hypothetical protein
MPTYRVSKTSLSRRRLALYTYVRLEEVEVDIPYSTYITSSSLYVFSVTSIKCAKYIHRGVYYSRNFSKNDFNHLTIK